MSPHKTPVNAPGADAPASERTAGLAAREHAPLKHLGRWNSALREASALSRLQAQEPVRDAALLPLRYARMASSRWAYLRGAAAVMAADLATAPHSGLTVQLCGDAHILNFGLWASPERQLLFDARDFDETLPGPFEWDIKRLATSVYVLAAELGLATATADAAVASMTSAYVAAMQRYATTGELEIWYDSITAEMNLDQLDDAHAEQVERFIAHGVKKRTQSASAQKLTTITDGHRRITDDPPRRTHFTLEQADEASVYEQILSTYLESVPTHLHRLIGRFQRADSVRQVVGVGSVGMRVYLHLMEGESSHEPVFFQVKQATSSVYEQFLGASEFNNHGQRVAVGQRLMQTASDVFLGHARVGDEDFYVRQFRDMKIIPSGEQLAGILPQFASICGRALAKSHARSGSPAAIATYLGSGTSFGEAMQQFGRHYAQQTHDDHADLVAAIAAGDVQAAEHGW